MRLLDRFRDLTVRLWKFPSGRFAPGSVAARRLARFERSAPLILLVVLASAPIAVWTFLDVRENRAVRDLTRQYGESVRNQVQTAVDARIGLLQMLADQRGSGFLDNEATAEHVANLAHQRFPGMALITWVDSNQIMRWTFPRTPASQALVGRNIRNLPLAPYSTQASVTHQPIASPPLSLVIGGRGFLMSFPVVRGGKPDGRLSGITRVTDLMDIALRKGGEAEYQVLVSDGELPLYERTWADTERNFQSEADVSVLSRHWTIRVQPRPEYVATLKTPVKTFVLIGGLLFAIGMAFSMGIALRNRRMALHNAGRFHDAIEALPAGFLLWDADERLVLWNSHMRTLYPEIYPKLYAGLPYPMFQRLVGQTLVHDPVEPPEVRYARRLAEFRSGGRHGDLKLLDGRIVQIVDWRAADGSTVSLRMDITQSKQQEAKLQEAQAHLFEAIEALSVGFMLWDPETKLVLWNSHMRALYPDVYPRLKAGMTYDAFQRMVAPWVRIPPGADVDRRVEARQEAFRDASGRYELLLNDGRTIEIEDWRAHDGSTVSLRTDITQIKQREQILLQSQRMDALGKLSGGIAHDFNNLLTVILGSVEILMLEIQGHAGPQQRAETIRTAALRGADLTSRLLAYSRRQNLRPEAVDLNRLMKGMGEMLRRVLGEHIKIESEPAEQLWAALADASQMENAILNLAVNARDAMPSGGTLSLRTANLDVAESSPSPTSAQHPSIKSGRYVMLCVADTGEGMAPETIQRAFEPFFTTKGPGRGSGLGLSMVYGFVTQSGGHIALDSTPGEGTRITIYLPATEQAEPSSRDARTPAAAVPTGTERILVVEDDDLVRRTVVHHFKNLGYRVLEADSGTAALEILQGKEPVDLLFTDVVMPGGLMGQELAAQASRLRPGLRILYTSGYTENSFLRDSPLDFGAVLLAKPYTREALAQQVRSVLDAKPRHTTP